MVKIDYQLLSIEYQMLRIRKKYGFVSYINPSSQKLKNQHLKKTQIQQQFPRHLESNFTQLNPLQIFNKYNLGCQNISSQRKQISKTNRTHIKKQNSQQSEFYQNMPASLALKSSIKITNIKQLSQKKRKQLTQVKNNNHDGDCRQNQTDDFSYVNRVKIGELYREGNFGKVYRAVLLNNGCKSEVVVKKIQIDDRYMSREEQFAKILKSPYIVQFIGCYYTEKSQYKQFDILPIKQSLQNKKVYQKSCFQQSNHKQKNQMPSKYLNIIMKKYNNNLSQILQLQNIEPYRIKIYLYQMIRSLIYLHSLNICHRDIKPHNFVLKNNRIFLCDFGAAKIISKNNEDKNASYVFSRQYRPPQLLFGKQKYDKSVDIWAIGCVAAQMVLKKPIFSGSNNLDQLVKILKVIGSPKWQTISFCKQAPPPKIPQITGIGLSEALGDRCDRQLCDLIMKMLKIQPKQRISAIQALCSPYFDEIREETFYRSHLKSTNLPNFYYFSKRQCFGKQQYLNKLIPFWIKQHCKRFEVQIKDYIF